MTLNFGPALVNPLKYEFDPNSLEQGAFMVYGNDMLAEVGVPIVPPLAGGPAVRDYEFFENAVNGPSGTLILPSGPENRNFRVTFTFLANIGAQVLRFEVIGRISVAQNAPNGFQTSTISSLAFVQAILAAHPGATYAGAEPDSIRVARLFDQVSGAFSATNPFEFAVPQNGSNVDELGLVLLNPNGYNYEQVMANGRTVPLVARVDYDVYDWRVLREDFRIPDSIPSNYHLPVGNLKVAGGTDVDGQPYTGMGFNVPDGNGNYGPASDLVLMDIQTGGVYLYNASNPADPTPPAGPVNEFAVDPTKSSYTVDKSLGIIRFNDFDRNFSNGLQLQLLLPGATSPVTVSAAGRAVRALYMARNEWAVQVYKAAEQYFTTYATPTSDSFYVGSSAAAYGFTAPAGENPALATHRIYFPEADDGRKVVIDTIWFQWRDSGNAVHTDCLQSQAFTIGRDRTTNDFDPYIDIAQAASDFATPLNGGLAPTIVGFDFSTYGYAVRGVKGASVNVRVLWNPNTFILGPDSPTNFNSYDKWAQGYRRQSTETFLTKGVE
jgi:hypothetical protein